MQFTNASIIIPTPGVQAGAAVTRLAQRHTVAKVVPKLGVSREQLYVVCMQIVTLLAAVLARMAVPSQHCLSPRLRLQGTASGRGFARYAALPVEVARPTDIESRLTLLGRHKMLLPACSCAVECLVMGAIIPGLKLISAPFADSKRSSPLIAAGDLIDIRWCPTFHRLADLLADFFSHWDATIRRDTPKQGLADLFLVILGEDTFLPQGVAP